MYLEFRAYNEGAALRYTFPQQETKDFISQASAPNFGSRTTHSDMKSTERKASIGRARIADIQAWCERPLTLEFAGGLFCFVGGGGESALSAHVAFGDDGPFGLVSALGGPTSNTARGGTSDGHVTLSAGESTPWRVLVVGEKPGDLIERNYLLLNLNPPCALNDVSWIKPGKAMRDAALTTASAKAIVDLAPKLGIDYVGFDDHWFGKDDAGDATARSRAESRHQGHRRLCQGAQRRRVCVRGRPANEEPAGSAVSTFQGRLGCAGDEDRLRSGLESQSRRL